MMINNTINAQDNIALYKYKQQLEQLENCKGLGTSVITLLVSCKTSLTQVISQMDQRLTKSNNIKSCI